MKKLIKFYDEGNIMLVFLFTWVVGTILSATIWVILHSALIEAREIQLSITLLVLSSTAIGFTMGLTSIINRHSKEMHKELGYAEQKLLRMNSKEMVKAFIEKDLSEIEYRFGRSLRLTRLFVKAESKYSTFKSLDECKK
jgi:hypothetical protein